MSFRLHALVSHPIQYMVPLFQRLASHPEIELHVFYMSDVGLRAQTVQGLGEAFVWDLPLLEGYRSTFLESVSPFPAARYGLASIHPGIVSTLFGDRPSALYLHGYMNASEWLAAFAARARGIPILFHGDTVLESNTRRSPLAREIFRRFVCTQLDAALAMSGRSREFYRHYGVPESRIFWAPLAVDNAQWFERAERLRPQRASLRKRLGLPETRPVLLHVSVLRDVKRPFDLLAAAEKLGDKATWLVVGGGPLYETLAAEAKRRRLHHVKLVGPKNQGELADYYAASDIFVMCSQHEVNPLVVREAMCFSLPLVLSDGVQSAIDFVREGENGYTFPVADVAALTERIERLLSEPGRIGEMGAESRKLIEPWNYDVAVQGIVSALRATAAGEEHVASS